MEHRPIDRDQPQAIKGIIAMENTETGTVENITVTVEGFEDPSAGVLALMRFTQDVIKEATMMSLGPQVALNVLSEMGAPEEVIEAAKHVAAAMIAAKGLESMCDEHADELAEKLGASKIADDAEAFLRELTGE